MNPSLLWLAAALFTWGIGEGMFFIFQPIYLSQLGADPVQIGYILGAAGVAMTVAHIPAGYLADRVGGRPMLRAAWLTGTTATWLMALAPNLTIFVIGLLLYGFTAFVASPLNSYVTDMRGNWSIGRAITLISATFNAGIVIGPFTGGWLGDHFGLRTVYIVAASIFVVSTFFIFLIAAQSRPEHDTAVLPANLFRNTRFLGFLALGFVVILGMYLPQPFAPKFLQDVRHLSLSEIGLLATIGGAGNTILSFALGFLNARLGFILGQVGAGLFAALLWRSTGYGWLALGYFLLGGYRASRSLFMAQIRPLVHAVQMGLAYGMAETIGALTGILAPVAAGFLYEKEPALVYPLALVAIIMGIGLSLRFVPQPPTSGVQPTIEFPE
jgi:MFS transporter, DHA1 family, tetracycline resistance protein